MLSSHSFVRLLSNRKVLDHPAAVMAEGHPAVGYFPLAARVSTVSYRRLAYRRRTALDILPSGPTLRLGYQAIMSPSGGTPSSLWDPSKGGRDLEGNSRACVLQCQRSMTQPPEHHMCGSRSHEPAIASHDLEHLDPHSGASRAAKRREFEPAAGSTDRAHRPEAG